MPWQPTVRAYLRSVDKSDIAVADVKIRYGKSGIADSIRPGYCSLSLVSDLDGYPVDIHDSVQIEIDTVSGPLTLFTGKVSDKSVGFRDVDVIDTELTAVTRLADWARIKVGESGFDAQLDGDRIKDILTAALYPTIWSDATGTWAAASGSWIASDFIETIDAGQFDFGAYSGGAAAASELLTRAEASGLGHLYETPDGKIGYADASRRQDSLLVDMVDLPGEYVLLGGITGELSSSNIVNRITVNTFDGVPFTAESLDSQDSFGVFETSLDSMLADVGSAEFHAERSLEFYAYPYLALSSFTIRLSMVPEALRETLLRVYVNMPVKISGLPAAIKSADFVGFVEGWAWKITEDDAWLTLNISDAALSLVKDRWNTVNELVQWTGAPSGLAWENAEVIA